MSSPMIPFEELRRQVSRRFFLSAGSHLLGVARGVASLTGKSHWQAARVLWTSAQMLPHTHFAPKAMSR